MDASLALGFAFVALYSYERFNTPKINLDATTPARYRLAALGYVFLSLLLYYVLVAGLSHVPIKDLMPFVPGLSGFADKNFSPALIVALILTVLLSKIPGLSHFDNEMCDIFRRRASISSIAANLSGILKNRELIQPSTVQAAVTVNLGEFGIEPKDVVFEDDQSLQYLWTKIGVLMYFLRDWNTRPEYQRFVQTFSAEWEKLIADYKELSSQANRCFKLSCLNQNDPELAAALKDCKNHHAAKLQAFQGKVCDWIGRGLAHCHSTSAARREALVEFGLPDNTDVGLTVHQIVFVFAGAFVILLIGLLLSHAVTQDPSIPGDSFATLAFRTFRIAMTYPIAVMAALYLHGRRRQRVTPELQQRPWGRYFGAGLLAVGVGSVITIASELLVGQTLTISTSKFLEYRWIWQIRSMALAVMVAYMLDNRVGRYSRTTLRWIETAVAAGVMIIVSWIILEGLASVPRAPKLHWYIVLPVSTAISAFIGYFVPTSAREAADEQVIHTRTPSAGSAPLVSLP